METASCIESDDELALPEDLKRMAMEEFGEETVEQRRIALDTLRARLMELPEDERLSDMSDKSLIRYIRGKKYNVEKAFSVVREYVKFRKAHEEYFLSDPAEILTFFHTVKVLKDVDSLGRRVVTIIPCKGTQYITPEFMSKFPNALTKFRMWLFEKLSFDPYAQLRGVVLIMSFQNMTFWESTKFSRLATTMQHVESIRFVSSCVGLRLKSIMLFEEPFFFSVIWTVASLVLSEKVRSRFQICGNNYSFLAKNIPDISILPVCLGGQASDDFQEDNWMTDKFANES